jgi:hypothetical protein
MTTTTTTTIQQSPHDNDQAQSMTIVSTVQQQQQQQYDNTRWNPNLIRVVCRSKDNNNNNKKEKNTTYRNTSRVNAWRYSSRTISTSVMAISPSRPSITMLLSLLYTFVSLLLLLSQISFFAMATVPDRHRLVQHRYNSGQIASLHDNGYALDGQLYRKQTRSQLFQDIDEEVQARIQQDRELRKERELQQQKEEQRRHLRLAPWQRNIPPDDSEEDANTHPNDRELSSQLSGCCYNHKAYSAANLCAIYGNDCESGNTKSHDSGDSSCTGDGLSFIGISFSVNTASGNPYSYQLCDQFPMENIIDRDYEYVMSMDEDGWLVGGGYKTFDYSGKMPYVFVRSCLFCGLGRVG